MPASPAAPVILITGAAHRIGAATARHLHASGWRLALHCHQRRDALDALCQQLEERRPGSTLALQADLSDPAQAPQLVQATLARFGQLDGLVNNAASYHATPLDQATAAQWDRFMAINARAPFLLAQAAADALRARHGAIINLSDYYASQPPADRIPYAASKAALVAVSQGLARALAPTVRVNAIAPGAIAWPEQGLAEATKQAVLDATTLGRAGRPQDIAEAVHWLLQADYVTGQVIHVDGGRA